MELSSEDRPLPPFAFFSWPRSRGHSHRFSFLFRFSGLLDSVSDIGLVQTKPLPARIAELLRPAVRLA
jgi:hypothetical protein